jgi:hypothetical protein
MPTRLFTEKEKLKFEAVRRWNIQIKEIEITNYTKEIVSPFLKFNLGGTYCAEMYKKGKSWEAHYTGGSNDPETNCHYTHAIIDLKPRVPQYFTTRINVEQVHSYFQIMA